MSCKAPQYKENGKSEGADQRPVYPELVPQAHHLPSKEVWEIPILDTDSVQHRVVEVLYTIPWSGWWDGSYATYILHGMQ